MKFKQMLSAHDCRYCGTKYRKGDLVNVKECDVEALTKGGWTEIKIKKVAVKK